MPVKAVTQVFANLMASYHDLACVAHTDLPFPNRAVVARIRIRLLHILLAEYFGLGPNAPGFTYHLNRALTALRRELTIQAARAMRCGDQADRARTVNLPENRHEIVARVDDFLGRLHHIRTLLAQDIEALFDADPAAADRHEVAGIYPGIEAVAAYRPAHELHKLGFLRIPRMLTELAHAETGIDIHPGATIGPGFAIDHGTGVVIGETTIIGSNVRIYQGVTLGSLTLARDDDGNLVRGSRPKRHPTLCDNVTVYANASVLGGDTIVGAYTRIGANVRLTESVGAKMDVLVEGKNFRVRPRRNSATAGDQAYEDRKALSRLSGEGGQCCGDVDELDWPRRS